MTDNASRLIVGGELVLYGYVGGSFFDEGFSAQEVLQALAQLDGDITVRLNSGGGSAWDGISIYNALKARSGKVTVQIDAVALSAASVIAMAGTERVIADGGMIMIHNASSLTLGTKEDHSKSIDMLQRLDAQAAGLYARRTGAKLEDVAKLMDAETWFTAEEAIAAGFADRIVGDPPSAQAAAFDYSLYSHAPPALLELAQSRAWKGAKPAEKAAIVGRKETLMTDKPTGTATDKAADPNPAVVEAALATARDEGAKAARARDKEIRRAVQVARLPVDYAEELIDSDVTLEIARGKIIDKLAEADMSREETQANLVRTQAGADQSERFVQGATKALMARSGLKGGERNEFTGLTLKELARVSLERQNIKTSGLDPLKLAGAAFMPTMIGGMHSRSDFGNVLADVASKSMLKGWEEAAETFPLWTSEGSAPDFKALKRIDTNLFPALSVVEEGAEYTYGKLGDRGETVQVATYGKLFAITRQAIINDDMNAFTRVPQKMGRAAKRTIGNLVYAVLTANPTMSDGIALFHASHSNYTSSGTAMSVTSMNVARSLMARQSDPDSLATGGLNLRPKFLLVPVELDVSANVLMASQYDPANVGGQIPNPMRNTAQVISDARLSTASTTAWYLAADPNVTDTVEVTYLDGRTEPFLDQQNGWSIDGTEFKVRIDAGVKALDYRGLYKNVGA